MDQYLARNNLSLMQQLNCVCNTLAKRALTAAIISGYNDRPTQLLPQEDVALVIWGNKVTGGISTPLRFHASKELARSYLRTRTRDKWTNKHFKEVDWEHLDIALKNKADMYKIWQLKQTSRFCGTRVKVGMYSGEMTPDERCPNCGRCKIAAHHMLCPEEDRTRLLIDSVDELCRWMEAEKKNRPRVTILDPQIYPDEKRQTLLGAGVYVSQVKSPSRESRQNWVEELHRRSYIHTF
jgi:hypothetical protein